MINKKQVKNIKKLIKKNQNIVLFHHINPDGDCIASSFGLAKALRIKYPNKNIKVVADKNDYLPHLEYMNEYINWDKTIIKPENNDYLAIISDTSVESRVNFYNNFKNKIKSIIVYDHHQNNLLIKNVDVFWKESNYPASAIMTYELIKKLKIKLNWNIALIINHGILTDTNMYKLIPGDYKTIDISSKLNKIIGIEKQKKLYSKMFEKSQNEVNFIGWVFSNIKIEDDKIAYVLITKEIIKKFNLKPNQTTKVELLSNIKGIETWLFFIEYDDYTRVEFRSNNIEVDKIASEFGGGGHKHRSGCKLKNINEYQKIINRLLKEK